MVILPHYLAAVKGKFTSADWLRTNGPSTPMQFLLFTKDIGKEPLPHPAVLHPSGGLGCPYT